MTDHPDIVERLSGFIRDDYVPPRPKTALLMQEAAVEITRLRAEAEALAAGQCVNATADEGGRPYCSAMLRMRAALEWIDGATAATPGLTDVELGRTLASIGKHARAAIAATKEQQA